MRSSILEPLCITFLFLPRLFIDCNKKRSNKESLVAFPSLPSAPRLPLVKSASTAGIRAAGSRKPLPLQPLLPRSRPRAPQSESLWVLMAASGCVCVTVCVYVCMAVCNVMCLYAYGRKITPPEAFSYVAACWTRWAAPSHTECPCRVWALPPACTGWTTSPLHSHRKT